MAGNIKGITIEFRGDTTKLDKALRQVKNDSKGIDAELKKVNAALKFNPKNTELLTQKQKLLKDKVAQTAKSLEDLKDMQNQMDKDPSIDKNSEAYRALNREIVTTESKLKHFKAELAKVTAQNSKIYKLGTAFDTAGKKIEAAGRKLAPVSKAAAGVTAALGAITYKAGKTADEINTLSKQTGIATKDLQLYAAAADLTDVSVEAMAKSHQKLKKSMLNSKDGKGQADYFKQLGVDITNADGSLRDANDVFDETIAALGKMENETERDAIAMALFGKSAGELNPIIEDGGETYRKVSEIMSKYGLEPIDQEALDKANEFNDQIDTIKLVFTQAVQIIGTKLAAYLLPAMKKATGAAAKLAEKIASLSGKKLAKFGGFTAALTALSPVLIVVGKALQLFGGKMKKVAETVAKVGVKFPKAAKALRLIANPVTLIVAALAGLGLAIGKSGKSADDLVKMFDKMVKKGAKKFGEIIPKVVGVLKNIASSVVKNAPVIIQGLSTLIEAILKAFIKYAPKLIAGAAKLFTSLVTGLTEILPKLLAALANLIGAVIKKLPTFVPLILKAAVTMFSAIVQAIPQVVTALVKALPAIKTATVKFFKTVLTAIKDVFKGLKDWFAAKFATAVAGIKAGFTGVKTFFADKLTAIKDVFAGIKDWFKSKFSSAVTGLKNGFVGVGTFFADKWKAIKEKFANVKDWFATKFGDAWEAIKSKFSGWGAFWGGLWTKIKNKFKSIGTSIASAISGAVKSGINGVISKIESIINSAIGIINGAIDLINKIPGVSVGKVSTVSLPRLAKGGVLNGAQTVIAGEAGPEAIIPLDKLFAQMDKMADRMAEGNTTAAPVNIYINAADGKSAREIANEVKRIMITEVKGRRLAWQ